MLLQDPARMATSALGSPPGSQPLPARSGLVMRSGSFSWACRLVAKPLSYTEMPGVRFSPRLLIRVSSNGRTRAFGSRCRGSIPCTRAIAYTSGMTGAEKYFAERMKDPKYREAYESARKTASPRGLTDKAPTS